jgi:hypothetical protein
MPPDILTHYEPKVQLSGKNLDQTDSPNQKMTVYLVDEK